MLAFRSANTRAVNPERAVLEALEIAFGAGTPSCDLILLNVSIGHDVAVLSELIARHCPGTRVLATSCAGVVGRDGPGESLHDIALMAIEGDGFIVANVDGVFGATSFEKGAELARGLAGTPTPVRMICLLASGIDIANDALIAGIESVLGPDVVIFGATSSDQMQGISTFQAVDGVRTQHGAFAVGIWDQTLEVETAATHGFVAVGGSAVITKAIGNRIVELDGRPAWPEYLRRLGLPATSAIADCIPIGALAEVLPADLAEEYGNTHVLRVVTHHTGAGELVYATTAHEGTEVWVTVRDEDRIFRDMERMLGVMTGRRPTERPVAVFQADCLARGRHMFGRVMKEELVHRMQQPFATGGVVPPWFGIYGFGEYARLGGRNAYHNYTTALAAIYRRPGPGEG